MDINRDMGMVIGIEIGIGRVIVTVEEEVITGEAVVMGGTGAGDKKNARQGKYKVLQYIHCT